jgi:hypothetical protein
VKTMTDTLISLAAVEVTPACQRCGVSTRLYGVEPHPRLPHTDLYTYVCALCDTTEVLVVPVPKPKNGVVGASEEVVTHP